MNVLRVSVLSFVSYKTKVLDLCPLCIFPFSTIENVRPSKLVEPTILLNSCHCYERQIVSELAVGLHEIILRLDPGVHGLCMHIPVH